MSKEVLSLLKDLSQPAGPSGFEGPVREHLRELWDPLVDQLRVSRLGSLYATKRGSGADPRPATRFAEDRSSVVLGEHRPSVMLAAHMDTIGLMVASLADGFLRIAPIGGLDLRVLPGQPVIVHGRRDVQGLIVQPPKPSLPEDRRNEPVQLENLLVDTALPPRKVSEAIRPGDPISFAQSAFEMGEDLLAGPSLDNRASLAALTICLRELGQREHRWDLVAVATVQEELTFGGALTAGFDLSPTVAIAVDVTFARGPGLPKHKTFVLGKGPTNGFGPNIHPGVYSALKQAAERIEIPLTQEVLPTHSGTDAIALQIAGEGIPTGVLGIPLKYMHTPVEVVSANDIDRAGRLLAEFVAGLSSATLEGLSWD